MTTSVRPDRLGDKHYLTLILRLLADVKGQAVHDEVGGIDEKRWVHFVGLDNPPRGAQTWRDGWPPREPGYTDVREPGQER